MLYIKATTYNKPTKKGEEEENKKEEKDRKKPYIWACGLPMWIYNDNRMMLGNYRHRSKITRGFSFLLKERNINPDFIIGTASSGIAPAASLAQSLGKELLINIDSDFYSFKKDLHLEQGIRESEADLIISTSPSAIPYGVQHANKLGIGFAYVRSEKKDHGKGQLIEGNIKPGMKFFFIYNEKTLEEIDEITKSLEVEFKIKLLGSMRLKDLHIKMSSEELKGKKAVVIEDLFSTGGSSTFQVHLAREAGMICNHCFSIFSYGFSCLRKQFSGEINIGNKEVKLSTPCEIDSLLTFPTLLKVIIQGQFYPMEKIEAMKEEIEGFDERYRLFLAEKAKILENNINPVKK